MSENVRVKVSSILPVFIQTVLHGQQREEARVSVCLVAVDTRPPFLSPCTAIKLAARVTFDKKGKSHVRACTPSDGEKGGSVERLCFNLSQEPADTVDWNLCESDFSVPVMRLPSFTVGVYSRG